jgi:6-phosphogluconate dehydrogenase
VRRLARNGHRCVVFNRTPDAIKAIVGERVTGSTDLKQLVSQLEKPRAVWVMLPAGEVTEAAITQLAELLDPGDTIIDGGNAFYKDDIRRAKSLKAKGIHYIDCGTSDGVWGLDRGYCLMIGGDKEAVDRLDPIFNTLAPCAGDT